MPLHRPSCWALILGLTVIAPAAMGSEPIAEDTLPDVSAYGQRAPVYHQPPQERVSTGEDATLTLGVARANSQSAPASAIALASHEVTSETSPADAPTEPTPQSGRRLQLNRSQSSDGGTAPLAPGGRTEQLLSG